MLLVTRIQQLVVVAWFPFHLEDLYQPASYRQYQNLPSQFFLSNGEYPFTIITHV